jgi:hypothetical protein
MIKAVLPAPDMSAMLWRVHSSVRKLSEIRGAGIRPLDAAAALAGKRIALAAAPGDAYAFQSCRSIYDRLHAGGRITFFKGETGHGVQMFDGYLERALLQWVRQ